MNSYLENKLKPKLNSDSILLSDYKDIDESIGVEDLNFQKVRGSVRLLLKKVFTPKEVRTLKERILAIDFSK